MPLILMCGIPCSGKTKRAQEIATLLQQHSPAATTTSVTIINDDYTDIDRNTLYNSAREEKMARSNLKSKVERLLSRDCHVILDSLNYIKGFRYELYCLSKLLKTTQCVVHCDTPTQIAAEWNKGRSQEGEKYNDEIFQALVQRFEIPDSRNRWDSPLIVLYPEDPLPNKELLDAIVNAKPPTPNQSTQTTPLTSADFLHELDRQTQVIVSKILEFQREGLLVIGGGGVCMPGTKEKLILKSSDMTMALLRRVRSQFITYTKLHPIDDVSKISTFFVHYLNSSL